MPVELPDQSCVFGVVDLNQSVGLQGILPVGRRASGIGYSLLNKRHNRQSWGHETLQIIYIIYIYCLIFYMIYEMKFASSRR